MGNSSADKYLKDAYPKWKKRVKGAEESIVVFTPFFDKNLESLLTSAEIDFKSIKVVTDLQQITFSDHPKQLHSALRLIEMGVEVRMLSRIHAKVLWVDWRLISVGSQNFTSYARKSEELTVFPNEDISSMEISKVLKGWLNASEVVDPDLLRELLLSLQTSFKELKKVSTEIINNYEETIRAFKVEEVAKRAKQLSKVIKSSKFSFAGQSGVWLRKQYIPEVESWEWGNISGGYHTLYVWPKNRNLLEIRSRSDGTRISSGRLNYWPLLVAKTGQMYFARVAKTRVSYLRDSVHLSSWPGYMNFDETVVLNELSIDLPVPDSRGCNVKLSFGGVDLAKSSNHSFTYSAFFCFDGSSFNFLDGKVAYSKSRMTELEVLCREYCLENTEQLFNQIFENFKYEHQLSGPINSTTLLKKLGNPYNLYMSVISHSKTPVFVLETQQEFEDRRQLG